MKFVPRLEKPKSGNIYYNTVSSGGINTCIKGSPTVKGLNVLCNCVGYEVGRFNEESAESTCVFFGSMNAKSFYDYAKKWNLPTSDIPVLGACACWTGGKNGLGHVGNVEELDPKNLNCSISSSGYKSYEWKLTKNCNAKNNYGMPKDYKFQGFVINPHVDNESVQDQVNQALKLINDASKILEGIIW